MVDADGHRPHLAEVGPEQGELATEVSVTLHLRVHDAADAHLVDLRYGHGKQGAEADHH